ncbi:MAG: SDR family oxidoreductase [Actinomycetia bacterium]|nr:SDR family oxidoreductase [Actinomycetes bacterium]
MELGLAGRTVLVMGGSRGLGRATAEALVAEGARVIVTSRTEANAAETCRALDPSGERAVPLALDTERPESVAGLGAALDRIAPEGVYAAYVNTGGPPAGDFADFDMDAWRLAVQKLLLGPVDACRQLIPRLLDGGALLFNASSSVRVPIPRLLLSNTIRPAVVALAKNLSLELAPRNIRVNVLAPGRIATDRVQELDRINAERQGTTPEAVRAASAAQIPLGRYGEPLEYGRVAAFLLSPAASYVTGVTLLVDGGLVRSL